MKRTKLINPVLSFTVEVTKSFTDGLLKGVELVDTVNFPTEEIARAWADQIKTQGTIRAIGGSTFDVIDVQVIAHPIMIRRTMVCQNLPTD